MARFNLIQSTFLGGEWSPKCESRTDHPLYSHACKTLQNFIPLPQGNAQRRSGSRVITRSKGPGRLVPFIASRTQAYTVELTDMAISVIDTQTQARLPVTLVGPLFSSEPVLFAGSEIFQVQYAQSADVLWLCHPNKKPLKLLRSQNPATGVISFLLQPFDYSPLTSNFLTLYYPFRDANTTPTTITPSATTGTVTLTASTAIFAAAHVGALFKLNYASATGSVQIVTVGTLGASGFSTTATALVLSTQLSSTLTVSALPATTATSDWEEAAWNGYRGWPRSVALFLARLIFGGNQAQPDTVWGSKEFNYDRFMGRRFVQDADYSHNDPTNGWVQGVTNTDPFAFTIASLELNLIQWMVPGTSVLVGTLGAEYVLGAPDPSMGVGALNVSFPVQTRHGSKSVQAKPIGNTVLFVQKTGRRIRDLSYDYLSGTQVSEDQTLYAEHIAGNQGFSKASIIQMELEEARGILWCVNDAGALFGMLRDPRQKITAWHSHTLGSPAGTVGRVNSVACVPSPDGTHDDLWLSVSRTIGGSTLTTLEIMGQEYLGDTLRVDPSQFSSPVRALSLAQQSPYNTDCSVSIGYATYDGWTASPAQCFGNLWELEGSTVSVVADGFISPDTVVIAGPGSNLAGSVATTSGSGAVIGTGTAFSSLTVGEKIVISGTRYLVTAITDDTHLTLSPAPSASASGLNYQELLSGISYSGSATHLVVGLPYTSTLTTQRLEGGSAIGSAQGAIKRIDRAVVRFYRTVGGKVGPSTDSLEGITTYDPTLPMNSPLQFYTGDKVVDFPSDYDRDAVVMVIQDQPLPMTVSGISRRGVVNE